MKRRNEPRGHGPVPPPLVEQEEKPLDWEPIPDCLGRWTGFVLFWTADLGGQVYAQAMRSVGLVPHQVAILQMLDSEGPKVQAHLGKQLRVDKATMVDLLNNLESQGLVERRPHPADRRAFEVHLLEPGAARLKEAISASMRVTKRFFAALSASEQQTLHELLRRIAMSNHSQSRPEETPT